MQYGLFLAKTLTLVLAFALMLVMVISASRGRRVNPDTLELTHLNEKYDQMREVMRREILSKKALKREHKTQKQTDKLKQTRDDAKRLFVLDFHGDIRASAVACFREEITAVLSIATAEDEILVRLENAGGLVHEHGFAASQLARIRQRGLSLHVAVDKVAASGGYLMACVADRIIAAPFAIIGSIGVLAQIPNFHRLMDRHGVDFEQLTAGESKRSLTMFGENTEEDRAKLQAQLEETHQLFKNFVGEYRPVLDLPAVATGEYWHGSRALELKLIDELMTSDDYLLAASASYEIYQVSYRIKRKLGARIASSVRENLQQAWPGFR